DVLGAVGAVVEGRAIRRHARIEGPVVVIDDARIILGQALDDVAVEIEQVEVTRIAVPQNGDQPRVVGGEGRLRPITGSANLAEAAILELEQASVLNDENRAGQDEPWFGLGGEVRVSLDVYALHHF